MSSELESDMCYHVYGWCHKVKATKVTTCLAQGNGNLQPVGWLKVTWGLTACTLGSALGPALGNEYGRTDFSLSFFVPCLPFMLPLLSLSLPLPQLT